MRFTLSSDFAAASDVQQKVMAEVDRLGYCAAARFAINLSLEEAIINAIKHGNRFDLTKKIFVEVEINALRTRITIEDQGTGFDRTSVPDPRSEENLERCSGRGILLIEAYMNQVKWANHGRRVTMFRENRPDICPDGRP